MNEMCTKLNEHQFAYDNVARALMANALVSVEMGWLTGSARM